jgi:hypothetical protein
MSYSVELSNYLAVPTKVPTRLFSESILNFERLAAGSLRIS